MPTSLASGSLAPGPLASSSRPNFTIAPPASTSHPAIATLPPGATAARPLPGPGPAWFPSVMGTGILATLLSLNSGLLPGASIAATGLLPLGWLLALALAGGFALRCLRTREVLGASLRDPAQSPMWGTVSMGILALGSATATVLPRLHPSLMGFALTVDAVAWVIGTLLGLYTAIDFAVGLLRRRPMGRPTPVWGLPVVAPMVSATTGSTLLDATTAPWLQAGLFTILLACFALSLLLGTGIFASAYVHHVRHEPLPLALWPSLWIPLGVIGQSTAAAQSLTARSEMFSGFEILSRLEAYGMTLAGFDVHGIAVAAAEVYGVVILGVFGLAAGIYATVMCLRGAFRRMPFTPGWWAMTFPIGTCALGAHLMGEVHNSTAWLTLGAALTVLLVGTWTLCVTATLWAVTRRLRPGVAELQSSSRLRRFPRGFAGRHSHNA